MNFRIEPSSLSNRTITVPGDKSISHRALMFGALANGTTTISGFLNGEDCLRTMAALRSMGVQVEQSGETRVSVHGVGLRGLKTPGEPLDMGNSGTAMRLFAGLLCGQGFDCELTGDNSLTGRPMGRVIRPLALMNADIGSNDGKPPLRISGNPDLQNITYEMPVASAQVKSAVMLAGLYAKGETAVYEPAVTRDHTERMLRSMGAHLDQRDGWVRIQGGQELAATDIEVPSDLSSAAFPLLAAILSERASLTVCKVGVNATRTGVIEILRAMGADLTLSNERMLGNEPVADITAASSRLTGISVDPELVSLAIDEFPLLFVAAAAATGETRFTEIGELRVKESDRIGSMASGLTALGIGVDETPDGAIVRGGKLSGGTVESFGDHRIAMAFSVAATRADGVVTVRDTEAVDTSFPGFVNVMSDCGAQITAQSGS